MLPSTVVPSARFLNFSTVGRALIRSCSSSADARLWKPDSTGVSLPLLPKEAISSVKPSSPSSVTGSGVDPNPMLSLSPNPCTSSTSAAQTKDSGITDVVSIAPARIAENSFRLFFANSIFFILFLPPYSCFLIHFHVFYALREGAASV